MYTSEYIKEELYTKYILPTERKKENYVGIEVEMPIVALDGSATSYTVAQNCMQVAIEEFHLQPERLDVNGKCYSAVHEETGDVFSFDCSYNNLELSLGKAKDLAELENRFKKYVSFLNQELEKSGHLLTGMGINPGYQVNRKDFIETGRYQMLKQYLAKSKEWQEGMYFHDYSSFGAYASASQVQLDVEKDELISVIQAFSKVEPVKAVLFSNSVLESEPDLLCVRDLFWEHSTHGINPHNIGAFECKPSSIQELVEYIASTSIFCTEREGHYLYFHPMPIVEYLQTDRVEAEYFEQGEAHSYTLQPQMEDLEYLRTYKFVDLTFRGTIEFRSVCCQPLQETMTVAAFHLGLMEKVGELDRLLEQDTVLYQHGYSEVELRKLMNGRKWPNFVDKVALQRLCVDVLDLAKEGLLKRGFGEEKYLLPLYDRARTLVSPGRKYVEEKERGRAVADLVREYSL